MHRSGMVPGMPLLNTCRRRYRSLLAFSGLAKYQRCYSSTLLIEHVIFVR
jgi:hypothetical protein